MKTFFRNIGLVTIICISFIISEKTALVVKDIDTDLIKLKELEKEYYTDSQDAKIEYNTMIPGIEGKKINIDKTYKQIKKTGQINEKNFIYDTIKPKISIEKIYDKYIIKGNPKNKSVSIVFIINSNNDVTEILEILRQQNLNIDFFIEEKWIENNKTEIKKMVYEGHTIHRLNENTNLLDIEINDIIKNQGKSNFCYTEEENERKMLQCIKQKKHTIKSKLIHSTNPLKEIKKDLENGKIIALKANENTKKELNLIIKYITTKGYKIENLSGLLSEKNNN